MTKKIPPIIHQAKTIAQSRLFKIEEVDLEFSNGEKRVYERLRGQRKHGAVMIIPFLDEETLILVREYAVGTERYELGFPKGLIEPNETPCDAANRELQEEAGFGADSLVEIKPLTTAPGYMGSQMKCVIAKDLYESKLPADEPEPLEVVTWKLSHIKSLIERDDFTEARCLAALFLVMNR